DQRELPAVLEAQDASGQQQFNYRRRNVESEEAQQKVDRAHAAFDGAIDRTGALGMMEAHRERMHVPEHARAGAALRLFADRLEDGVAELRAGGGRKAKRSPEAGEAHEERQR